MQVLFRSVSYMQHNSIIGSEENEVDAGGRGGSYGLRSLKSLLKRWSSAGSLRRSSRTLAIECITVVWCLPPKCRPISDKEASVNCLVRNMAI